MKHKEVILIDFTPKSFRPKNHDLQYVTEKVKVAVQNQRIVMEQYLGYNQTVIISKDDFQTIVSLLETLPFPMPEVIEEETHTPINQKVVQADFAKKTFKKEYQVETTQTLRDPEGVITPIGSGKTRVLTFTNTHMEKCILISTMEAQVCFYIQTFQKVMKEVDRQENSLECKVLAFPTDKKIAA